MALEVRLRPDDPTPPYEQLRAQVVAAVATGALGVGTRLPSVRQLARDLGVATGTVARAYRELEAEGVVTTARGAGTTVAGVGRRDPAGTLRLLAGSFVDQARRLGASDDVIRAEVSRALTP